MSIKNSQGPLRPVKQTRTLAMLTTTVAVSGGLVAGLGISQNAGAASETGAVHEAAAAATTPLELKAVTPAKKLVVAPKAAPKKAAAPAAVAQPKKVSRSQSRSALTTRAAQPAKPAPKATKRTVVVKKRVAPKTTTQQATQHRKVSRTQTRQAVTHRQHTTQQARTTQVSRSQVRHATTTRQATYASSAKKTQAVTASVTKRSNSGVVSIASGLTGIPYVYAGSTPSGFDCSGFVSYVFAQAGIQLPHQSGAIKAMTTPTSNPQPGDLVFLPGHVAIYAGNGMVYEARHPGTVTGLYPVLPGSTFGRL